MATQSLFVEQAMIYGQNYVVVGDKSIATGWRLCSTGTSDWRHVGSPTCAGVGYQHDTDTCGFIQSLQLS